MKGKKNLLPLILICCSITLLIVLQVFWLQSSYEKAYFDLRRETSTLFRNTITDFRIAYFTKNFVPIENDSVPFNIPLHDSIPFGKQQAGATNVQVFITGGKDSIHSGRAHKRGFVQNIQMRAPSPGFQKAIIRFSPDSLNIDSLSVTYQAALHGAGIVAPFEIKQMNFEVPDTELNPLANIIFDNHQEPPPPGKWSHDINAKIYSDTITSEMARFSPLHRYSVSIWRVRSILVHRITPQILFSIFLTLITTTAFVFMYRSIRSQQRLMEVKNDFISNVTHELRTPVATVSVSLEALKNFNVLKNPTLSQEYLEIAQRELERLNEITDRILKTSVLEKEIVITPETNDFDAIIQKVLADMKMILDQRKAKVSYQKQGTDFSLHGDAHHLYQVIENLIDNALKYSTGAPEIELSLSGSENSVSLEVSDYGIGIQKEYQDKIFEKFFRIPTGNVHNVKGYGLGLSYVHNFVKSLGGDISVESEPGKRSTFILKFPRIKIRKLSFRLGK